MESFTARGRPHSGRMRWPAAALASMAAASCNTCSDGNHGCHRWACVMLVSQTGQRVQGRTRHKLEKGCRHKMTCEEGPVLQLGNGAVCTADCLVIGPRLAVGLIHDATSHNDHIQQTGSALRLTLEVFRLMNEFRQEKPPLL